MNSKQRKELRDHAARELALLDQSDRVKDAVLHLIDVLADLDIDTGQCDSIGHLFQRLACLEHVTRLTNRPDEWRDTGRGSHQCIRNPHAFSRDNLKTYTFHGNRYRLQSEHSVWTDYGHEDLI